MTARALSRGADVVAAPDSGRCAPKMPATTSVIPSSPVTDSDSPSSATESGATTSAGVPRAMGYTSERSPAW